MPKYIEGDKMKKLKSNIGWLINKEGYTRKHFAKRYNKTDQTISNWCTGKSYPSAIELWDLADLLKVKVDDLYEREEEK